MAGIPLWAQLRTGDKDGADGGVAALEKIVAAIRKRCRQARIIALDSKANEHAVST